MNDQENNALLVNIFNNSCHDLGEWKDGKFIINKVYTEKYKVAPNDEGSYRIFVWETEFVEVTGEEKEPFTGYGYASYKRKGLNGKEYMGFYLGEWENGQRTGAGTIIYDDGDIYEGEVRKGMRHGKGRHTIPWGESYIGDWKEDAMDGNGTRNYENGEKYEGERKEGKITGVGRFYYKNGEVYDGEWKDGKRNGGGFLYFPDGSLLYTQDGRKEGVADGKFLYQSPEGEKGIVFYKDGEQVQN